MALACSIKAPEFRLKSTTGKPVILSEVLKRGPVVLAFFKVGCPVCQYAFPDLAFAPVPPRKAKLTLVLRHLNCLPSAG